MRRLMSVASERLGRCGLAARIVSPVDRAVHRDDLPCALGVFSAPWCVGYAHSPYAWESAWPIHAFVFGVPVAGLVIGVAIVWAISGFRKVAGRA